MKDLICKLVEAYGPSGQEGQVRAIIEGLARGAPMRSAPMPWATSLP